jgi:hypothetical protein
VDSHTDLSSRYWLEEGILLASGRSWPRIWPHVRHSGLINPIVKMAVLEPSGIQIPVCIIHNLYANEFRAGSVRKLLASHLWWRLDLDTPSLRALQRTRDRREVLPGRMVCDVVFASIGLKGNSLKLLLD